jgi:hypothetical protein
MAEPVPAIHVLPQGAATQTRIPATSAGKAACLDPARSSYQIVSIKPIAMAGEAERPPIRFCGHAIKNALLSTP